MHFRFTTSLQHRLLLPLHVSCLFQISVNAIRADGWLLLPASFPSPEYFSVFFNFSISPLDLSLGPKSTSQTYIHYFLFSSFSLSLISICVSESPTNFYNLSSQTRAIPPLHHPSSLIFTVHRPRSIILSLWASLHALPHQRRASHLHFLSDLLGDPPSDYWPPHTPLWIMQSSLAWNTRSLGETSANQSANGDCASLPPAGSHIVNKLC